MTLSSRLFDTSLAGAVGLATAPERWFRMLHERKGERFILRLPGIEPVLMRTSPEAARALFAAPAETFDPPLPNPLEPLLGESSLILLAGARHRRERQLLMPAFHGERMRRWGATMAACTRTRAARLTQGVPVDACALARDITLDVILDVVFGLAEHEAQQALRTAIVAMIDAYGARFAAVPALRRSLLGGRAWSAFQQKRAALRELLRGLVQRSRGREGDRGDVLASLLSARDEAGDGLDDEAIVDELCTLLVAGHETTATALAWVLHYLHTNPALEQRAHDDLASLGAAPTPEQLASSACLRAFGNEALRMHPAVPLVARRLRIPYRWLDEDLPAGTQLALSVTELHRRPELYAHPDTFDPERFLVRDYKAWEFIPFGGGVRRCLGAAMAMYELPIVLGTLLRQARFVRHDKRAPRAVLGSITMGPGAPIWLIPQ
ncbi:MAG TPA: cytochrome P450 [Polyangiales bacterium]